MSKANHEVHTLGVFVHGALSALHALGFVYNLKRRQHFDSCAHAFGLWYSLRATAHHHRECINCEEIPNGQSFT